MAYSQPYTNHPYNYAQYTQHPFSPDYQSGQVPFPATQQPLSGHTPVARPKKITRNTNAHIDPPPPPLKSAMKRSSMSRSDRVPPAGRSNHSAHPRREEEKRRGREQPEGGRRWSTPSQREDRSLSRSRTNSRGMFTPDHIFVSFKRDNELCVSNLVDDQGFGTLAEAVLNMWPDGHDEMETQQHKWRVVFHGSPWTADSTGHEGIAARRIIRNIFIQLAIMGFSYTTTTNASRLTAPSLLFSRVPPEIYPTQTTDFFILSTSSSHKRLTFIEAPDSIVRHLAHDLKQYFPHQISSDRIPESGMLVLEIRNRVRELPPLDRHMFIAWVLQYVHRKGYVLEASVPLATKTFGFVLGRKKEVWVFRRRGKLGI